MTDPLASADIDTADSPHYLRALTDMADRRTVVAGAAIYTDNGIKLVEKGARIDSRLYDRLVQHKLREPIDRHLSIDKPVDVPALLVTAQALIEQEVLLGAMAQAVGSAARLLAPLRSVPLPGPMACKLTVMREQRNELFEHSLRMMVVAVFLGIQGGMAERDCVTLAAAALLLSAPRAPVSRWFLPFALGVAGFLGVNTAFDAAELPAPWWSIASFLSRMAAVFVWLFCLALFDGRLRAPRTALAVGLAWLLLVEGLLVHLLPRGADRWALAGVTAALSYASDEVVLPLTIGGPVFLGYALLLFALGAAHIARRDIT